MFPIDILTKNHRKMYVSGISARSRHFCNLVARGLFGWQGFTKIWSWMCDYISYILWDVITHPWPLMLGHHGWVGPGGALTWTTDHFLIISRLGGIAPIIGSVCYININFMTHCMTPQLCIIEEFVKIYLVLWNVACIMFCMSWGALVLADDLVPWLFTHPALPECARSSRY